MFMKDLLRGKMPKTEQDIVQEKKQQELIKRQSYQVTEELLDAMQRKVQPILDDLKWQCKQATLNCTNCQQEKDGDTQINLDFSNDNRRTSDMSHMKKDKKSISEIRLIHKKQSSHSEDTKAETEAQIRHAEWKKTEEQFKSKIQELEHSAGSVKNTNYLNLFGVDRGKCEQPACQKICDQYRGSYNIKSYSGVELFSCINCKCPMNSHSIPKPSQSFSNSLSEELSNKYIESPHLNYKCISYPYPLIGVFLVWPEEEEEEDEWSKKYPIPENAKRRMRQQNHQYNANLEKLVQIFNEGCFDILSYYDCDHYSLFEKLVEKKIFSIKKPVPKQEMDSFLAFLKSFQKAERSNMKGSRSENNRGMLNNEEDLPKFQLYNHYKEKIQQKFDKISMAQGKSIEDAHVYVLLISSKYSNPYTQFRRFLVATRKQFPKEFVYYYSSKYKYKGIIDSHQFFPDFFKINYQTFVLAQHIPKKMYMQARADPTLNSEKLEKKLADVKEREIKKNDDKLRDYLDFNNFAIIEEDFSEKQDDLDTAFDFIDEDEKNRVQFFKFCQVGTKTLNLKICAKIGPPTYTTIGADAPNIYRITDEYDNDSIATHLCDDLNYSQRVSIVLRPIVVKSKMDEVLLNIFRINNFIVVNRIFTLLTYDQAKLLAKLEGITEKNQDNYINMMREGMVSIILLTKPGGIKSVQLLSNGCDTGLKLQQTNYLDELFVHHEQGGVIFKEKINKQFYNVFQSYTNLNMFTGIKQLFNLERLIFQEENNEDEELGNIFINTQTNQVHYNGKDQQAITFGKRYTAIKRSSIVDDINSETFNFFLCCPKNELTSEQIVSVFMPECANMQLIHIVLKPQCLQYLQQVIKQLQKLKFKVWNTRVRSIASPQDAKQFVGSLQVIKNSGTGFIETLYNTEEFAILSCVKPAGRKEMLSFLQDFKIEYTKGSVTEPILTPSLKYMLIPCHTDLSHDLAQHYINSKSRSFNGIDFHNMGIEDKKFCAQFMLETTFATGLIKDKTISPIKEKIFNNPLYPSDFYHYIAHSEDLGDFEIRILNFNSYNAIDVDFSQYASKFKLQSWYYSMINKQFMQRCPLTYQYRLMPDYKDFEFELISKGRRRQQETPTHVFDVSEYCGGFFLETVAEQMLLYRDYEMSARQKQLLKQNDIKQYRGSVAAYLWGMRLAKFVKEMEFIEYPSQIEGFGEIKKIAGKYQGADTDNEFLEQNLMQNYHGILDRIKKELEVGKESSQESNFAKMFEHIKNQITTICKSDIFKRSRSKDMRRIFPSFVESENLRVRVDNRQIHKRNLNKDYQTQDEHFEQRTSQVDLKQDIQTLIEIADKLANLENLEGETRVDGEVWKRKSKEGEESMDTIDLKKRAKFLDEDAYMALLIHYIKNKKGKVKGILKNLEVIEKDAQMLRRQEEGSKYKTPTPIGSVQEPENEEDPEKEFSMKKHLDFLESTDKFITGLNEKYNGRNGTFNLRTASRINTFSFAYVHPMIKSKYSLVANVLYLLEVQFRTISTKQHLTKDDPIEYSNLIDAILQGFKTHYRIDPADLSYLREKFQDRKLMSREKEVHIPDFIRIELFFTYLTQMERHLILVEEKRNILKRILDEQGKELRDFKEKMASGRQDVKELKKIEEKWIPQADKVRQDKNQIEQQISKLLNLLFDFKTDFNYEESMQKDDAHSDRKTFVAKQNYFQRIDNVLEYFESDPDLPIFQVDIMDVKYKFEFGEENPNLKSNPKNIRVPLLEKHGEKEFLKNAMQDPLQKQWFNTSPLLISHMRPVRAEDRNYILVEKQRQGEKSESESAIEREIRRFKREAGLPIEEDADESEELLEQKMKQTDYEQYKIEQMRKKMKEQMILDERYDASNPNRDKNYAEDLVNNYWNQIEEERQKIKKEREAQKHSQNYRY